MAGGVEGKVTKGRQFGRRLCRQRIGLPALADTAGERRGGDICAHRGEAFFGLRTVPVAFVERSLFALEAGGNFGIHAQRTERLRHRQP